MSFQSILPAKVFGSGRSVVTETNPVAVFCRHFTVKKKTRCEFDVRLLLSVAQKIGLHKGALYDCLYDLETSHCRIVVSKTGRKVRNRSTNSLQLIFTWPELIPAPSETTQGNCGPVTFIKDGIQFKLTWT